MCRSIHICIHTELQLNTAFLLHTRGTNERDMERDSEREGGGERERDSEREGGRLALGTDVDADIYIYIYIYITYYHYY